METKKNKVCVIGQGFVGLPLALSFSLNGIKTIGVDINEKLVTEINKGNTPLKEEYNGQTIQIILKAQLNTGNYNILNNIKKAVQESNVIVLTVGIPIYKNNPIMDGIINAIKEIGKNLKKDDLVLIRSTVIPGTTEEILLPILEEESKLKAGKDFYLAYASERIAEGQAFYEFENMPTVVAGINEESFKRAEEVLKIVCKADIIKASSIKVVETSKVFENVQRDVNIAMAQEFARFSEKVDIDIFEVIEVANSHKRVNLLTPGPGVGGYCIPNAYYYLKPKAEELNLSLDILKLCREKNKGIPYYIVSKVEKLLNSLGKNISNCKIGVLGIAMKDYSNDDRLSPVLDIINLFIEKKALTYCYDPAVDSEYEFKKDNINEVIQNADVLIVAAKQKEVNYENLSYYKNLMKENPIYIDLKNVIDEEEANEHGFIYWKI
ncbi:nucleotide sugar dehydrogenase [Clostridium botulinum]|uniref:Nucleotide sugar dehydrogenase n=1 Tax=Clostridium botulinum TaxID=1491 RepID=A0A6G4EHV5_CLOBO|nr:nucleotide sugar dehydrogenase [Clostridium botulinum]APH19707.1 nucleotide sugar dehydrogenase family protein [Clostridium botulinum]AUM92211.1 nucleotide sugar dehydrogenase [Clostridium botulinum]KEJ02815.1 capsular biosynthesis protein [Clostridium botulinum A2B3 87]MCC5424829.1 nucleotide sugar dehydrogenase [Clostridium botulinum]NFB12570.1 nucleotide sugar dehydrogenase [Clostridium botulinum]